MSLNTASMSSPSNHFINLFRYTHWANRQMIEALLEATPPETRPLRRARALLSHLLRAQDVWLGRVQNTDAAQLPFWEEDPLDECVRRSEESSRDWLAFLRGCTDSDFARPVHYQNSKGTPFATDLQDLAAHVVNHATHHRAQIALLLREAGLEPPATDYIFYVRRSEDRLQED